MSRQHWVKFVAHSEAVWPLSKDCDMHSPHLVCGQLSSDQHTAKYADEKSDAQTLINAYTGARRFAAAQIVNISWGDEVCWDRGFCGP